MADQPLSFREFDIPGAEDWRAAASKALKGADFDRTLTTPTYEGLSLQPIYGPDDSAQQDTLPGFPPFTRGSHSAGYLPGSWQIAQEINAATPEALNIALRHALSQGQDTINLRLDDTGLYGFENVADWARAFDGIDLAHTPILIQSETNVLAVAALIMAYLNNAGIAPADLRGSIIFDPLATLAAEGDTPVALDSLYDEMAALTRWAVSHAPQLATTAVDTRPYHEAGANAVQELAYALATGVEHIRAMQARSLSVDEIAPRMGFSFGMGGHFFMEIAKLRAARTLWSQVVAAFGGSAESQKMHLHTRTGQRNKTCSDAHTNLLRTTFEVAGRCPGRQRQPARHPL